MTVNSSRRATVGTLAILGGLAVLCLFELGYGQVQLSASQILQALYNPDADPVVTQIVREIRLPRISAALVAGGALGVAGAAAITHSVTGLIRESFRRGSRPI